MEKPQYSLPAKKNPAQFENFQHTKFLIKRIDNHIIWETPLWYFLIAAYIIILMVLMKEKNNHYSCNFIWVINIEKIDSRYFRY